MAEKKNKYTSISLRLDEEHDADVIEILKSCPNRRDYLVALVRSEAGSEFLQRQKMERIQRRVARYYAEDYDCSVEELLRLDTARELLKKQIRDMVSEDEARDQWYEYYDDQLEDDEPIIIV